MARRFEGGLRSDGELVQAAADRFDFVADARDGGIADADHRGWIEILDVGPPVSRPVEGDDDDDGLPDTIIWCIDGDGGGDATGGRMHELAFEIETRTWSVDGEAVDGAGMSALLFL